MLTRYYLLEICKAELNEMLHLQISVFTKGLLLTILRYLKINDLLHLQISVGEGIVSGTLYLLLSSASLAILLRVI